MERGGSQSHPTRLANVQARMEKGLKINIRLSIYRAGRRTHTVAAEDRHRRRAVRCVSARKGKTNQ